MGTIELDKLSKQLYIHSNIIMYGACATENLVQQCAAEIENMWNEPNATVQLKNESYNVVFVIKGYLFNWLKPEDIYTNLNPKNNYFRVEEFVQGNISFVDGLGCNTGLFKMENLYHGSTTAAHEYGHTIGLDHPVNIDIRGCGVPGIMYPRGTLVDPQYQYEPDKPAGEKGGTLHPRYRKVRQADIDLLNLAQYNFNREELILGDYSAVYHMAHTSKEA